jgi:hypothetical protein
LLVFSDGDVFLVLVLKVTELPFFASKVRLGRSGVEEILPLGPLNEFERSVVKCRANPAFTVHLSLQYQLHACILSCEVDTCPSYRR